MDVSLGGVSIACEWPCDVGNEVLVGLPAGEDFVSARIVESRGGVLAVTFRQDPASLAIVGRALNAIVALPNLDKAAA